MRRAPVIFRGAPRGRGAGQGAAAYADRLVPGRAVCLVAGGIPTIDEEDLRSIASAWLPHLTISTLSQLFEKLRSSGEISLGSRSAWKRAISTALFKMTVAVADQGPPDA